MAYQGDSNFVLLIIFQKYYDDSGQMKCRLFKGNSLSIFLTKSGVSLLNYSINLNLYLVYANKLNVLCINFFYC